MVIRPFTSSGDAILLPARRAASLSSDNENSDFPSVSCLRRVLLAHRPPSHLGWIFFHKFYRIDFSAHVLSSFQVVAIALHVHPCS